VISLVNNLPAVAARDEDQAPVAPGRPWPRWLRSAGGFLAVAAGAFLAWGLAVHAMELEATAAGAHHLAHGVHAGTVLLTLAAWTAWRSGRADRRLAATREALVAEEAALREERWRAAQAEGLSAFARILAHELRNPLNAMALHGALVKRAASKLGAEGESIRDASLVLEGQVKRMNELLDSYLATSGAAAVPHAPEPVALDALADEAVAERRAALDEQRIHYRVERAPGLPPILGDRARLLQALRHVLQNACEAMPDGGEVAIHTGVDGDHVVLTVRDEGPGLTSPDAVFRPFFTTRHAAGLGLAVVRDVVRAHRGEVSADNAEPRGARITIRLPRATGALP
jgi:signal transduction histidine kinase